MASTTTSLQGGPNEQPPQELQLAEHEGDRRRAVEAYENARRLYALIPDPRHSAHAEEAQARVLGPRPGAHLYRAEHETFTRLDAPWEANRIKHVMRRAGLRMGHRRGRRSFGDALSPREQEVATLAAGGATNGEIANELFLSRRTVETHIKNILRKLEISSRKQLPEALDRADEPRNIEGDGFAPLSHDSRES